MTHQGRSAGMLWSWGVHALPNQYPVPVFGACELGPPSGHPAGEDDPQETETGTRGPLSGREDGQGRVWNAAV